MKKILSFLAILIILFVALTLITNSQKEIPTEGTPDRNSRYEENYNGENPENNNDNEENNIENKNEEDTEENNPNNNKAPDDSSTETGLSNPYQKKILHPETIKRLEDPNYQNIILPQTLEEMLANGEDVIVYFYSPLCPYCIKTTPLITELAQELNKEIYQFNLLEFEHGWDEYQLEAIPTLIQYKEGKETKRTTGYQEKGDFKEWLLDN